MWQEGKSLQSGKYQIIRCIGRGGFGLTYLALDCLLQRQIVIKTPNRPLRSSQTSERSIRRFQREGQILSKFSHPNIVTVLDFFREEEFPCLVMAYIEGETLEQYIHRSGPLSEGLAIATFQKISYALHLLHQEGIVHCDIHPGNIIINADKEPVLIDFGSTKMVQPGTSTVTTTINENYAPYEQGKTDGTYQPSLDVYGLAATLYFSVSGHVPQSAIHRKLYGDTLQSPQEHKEDLSDHINQAILQGMELEPEMRPSSIKEWESMVQVSPNKNIYSQKSSRQRERGFIPPFVENKIRAYPLSQRKKISMLSAACCIAMLSLGFFPQSVFIGADLSNSSNFEDTAEVVILLCGYQASSLFFTAAVCIFLSVLSRLLWLATQENVRVSALSGSRDWSSNRIPEFLVALLGALVTFIGFGFVHFLPFIWPALLFLMRRAPISKEYSWIRSFWLFPLTILGGALSFSIFKDFYYTPYPWEITATFTDRFNVGLLLGSLAYIQWTATYYGLKYTTRFLNTIFRLPATIFVLLLITVCGLLFGLGVGYLNANSLHSFLIEFLSLSDSRNPSPAL